MSSIERRNAATEQYATATNAINTLFDRADELRHLLGQIENSAQRTDPLRAASDVSSLAEQLPGVVVAVQHAATTAGGYRNRSDLAADLDTTSRALFPRLRDETTIGPDIST